MLTDKEKIAILRRALEKAGKFMREFAPPYFPDGEYKDMYMLYVDAKSDPEGEAFVRYFLEKAIIEEETKNG